MLFEVLETETFSKLFDSLAKDEQKWVKKMIGQLKQNAFVGKPLRFPWFREKKYKGKRLYYLVYQNLNKVLLAAYGSKKEQQRIIAHVLANLEEYKRIVEQV